jgi:WD40 repeat protein
MCLLGVILFGGVFLVSQQVMATPVVSGASPVSSIGAPNPVPPIPTPTDAGITCLLEWDASVYAKTGGVASTSYFVSDDGGLTWRSTAKQSTFGITDYCLNHDEAWQLWESLDGQLRYRMTPKVAIERSANGGAAWTREVDLTGESWQGKPSSGTPVRLVEQAGPADAMVHRPTGNVIVAMGHLGVMVRASDGKWQWVRVGNYARGEIASLTPAPPRTTNLPTPIPMPEPKTLRVPASSSNNSNGVAFSGDNQMLVTVGYNAFHFWRIPDGTLIRSQPIDPQRGLVQGLMLSPDGQTLAVTPGGQAQLWRASDAQVLKTFSKPRHYWYGLAFSPDGQTVATGSSVNENNVQLWRVADGTALRALAGHSGGTNGLIFSPDGRLLAGSLVNHQVCVWNVSDGKLLYTFEGGAALPTLDDHRQKGANLAFSADNQTLAFVDSDGSYRVWRMSDGGVVRNWLLPIPHGFELLCAAFSRDGKTLATCLGDGTLRLWRTTDAALLSRYNLAERFSSLADLAFSPNDQFLAAAKDSGNTGYLWDVKQLGLR